MDSQLESRLEIFQTANHVVTKGPLACVIQLTRKIKYMTMPLYKDDFLTANSGQVAGLSGANLKRILKEYGITQVLASEGGRTSRGGIGLMLKYIDLLNKLALEFSLDFDQIEEYWVEQVRVYFTNQPFILIADPSKTATASLNDLFDQAKQRQKQNPGNNYAGIVLQYLVSAKLSLLLGPDKLQIYSVSSADASTERIGDFMINDTIVLHCTTAPSEPLIQKCRQNINANCQPIIITVFDRVRTALDLADDADLVGRIEVWDVQQFISANINEHSLFDGVTRNARLADIIDEYNSIVSAMESDPSLRIEYAANIH